MVDSIRGVAVRDPGRSSTSRRWVFRAQIVGVIGIAVGAGFAIYAERSTIDSGLAGFRHHIHWLLFVAAIASEIVSMAAFALMQRRLLHTSGVRLTLSTVMAMSYTSTAISIAVPLLGSGMATAYTYRQLRRHAVDPASAGLALTIGGILSTVAFALVVAFGTILSGNPIAAALGLVGTLALLVAVGLALAALHWPRARIRLERIVVAVIRRLRRLRRRPDGDVASAVHGALDQVRSLRLSPRALSVTFGYAMLNWLADALCLALSILTVGAHLRWDRLLLVWSAGAGAASLCPTPGGLGVVDIVLIAALAGTGVPGPRAVAAVILYRIISFKIFATLGWVIYRYVREVRRPRPAAG